MLEQRWSFKIIIKGISKISTNQQDYEVSA